MEKLSRTLISLYPPWQTKKIWKFCNSWKVFALQPIAAHSYMAILVRGGGLIPQSPPIAAQLLHHFTPSEQITPTLLHQFTPIDKLSPTLTTKWEYFREGIRPGCFAFSCSAGRDLLFLSCIAYLLMDVLHCGKGFVFLFFCRNFSWRFSYWA